MGRHNTCVKKAQAAARRARTFKVLYFGHSHIRRFGELIKNKEAYWSEDTTALLLDTLNEVQPGNPNKRYDSQLGYPNSDHDFRAVEGFTTPEIAAQLEAALDTPRDIQVIYAGDNDQRHCPKAADAAARVFRTVLKYLLCYAGPTILCGLLPRLGDGRYCKWAGEVNEKLLEMVMKHNKAPHERRIIWLQHYKCMKMDAAPKGEPYGNKKIHEGVLRWKRMPDGTWERVDDTIHMGYWALGKFYCSMSEALKHALDYLIF